MTEAAPSTPVVDESPTPLWTLLVPLAAHLAFSLTYAFLLPLWGAVPDEPIHYSHVKYVAEHWSLPVIDDPFRDLKEYYFVADPAGAAQHGPLYYWPAAVIYSLTTGLTLTAQQYVLRLWSVLLGALMVLFAWRAFALLFPGRALVTFGSTLLLTLIPHRLLVSAVIYADIGAAATATLALWALIWAVKTSPGGRGWVLAGMALGLAMLAKTSAVLIIPALLGALLVLWRRGTLSLRQADCDGLLYAAGMLLLSGWWLVRSVMLYGELLPTEPKPPGFGWLDVLFDPSFGFMLWMAVRGYWLSIWSQVGWLPGWAAQPVYGLLLALTGVTLAGLIAAAIRGASRGRATANAALAAGFVLTGLATFYAALHRTILVSFHSNEQTGKHAQTVLVAFIALAVAAWQHLAGARRVPAILMAAAGLMLILNVLSIHNLQTDLIPRFAPTPPEMATWKVKDLPTSGIPWVKERPATPNRYLINGPQSRHLPADGYGRDVERGAWSVGCGAWGVGRGVWGVGFGNGERQGRAESREGVAGFDRLIVERRSECRMPA